MISGFNVPILAYDGCTWPDGGWSGPRGRFRSSPFLKGSRDQASCVNGGSRRAQECLCRKKARKECDLGECQTYASYWDCPAAVSHIEQWRRS